MSGSLVRVDVLRGISGRILAERRTTELLKETTGRSYRYDALGRLSEQRIDVKTTQSAAQFVAQRANALANEDLHPFPQTDVVQQAAFTIADGLTSLTGDEEGRQHAASVDPLSDGVPVTSANGDAVTRDDFDRITGSQDLTMTFDVFDRLVLVVRSGKEMLRLAYDGLGNRVIERRYENGNMVDAVLHRFGGNVVEETQIDGTIIATTMHAPGVDAPLLYSIGKTIAGQKTNALLTNARGDVVAAGDLATGSVTEEQQLDVYGERTIATKANGVCVEGMENGTSSQPRGSTCATKGILGRFGIAGARAHPETKLVDMRARTYATHLKGFLTKDPLGPVDSHSLFGYVAGDPVNMRDPFGLSASAGDKGAGGFPAGAADSFLNTAEDGGPATIIIFHEDGDGDGGSAPASPPAPTPAPAPAPTPSPTPSPTPTPTPAPAPTPSPSPSPSPGAAPAPSPWPTPSPSPATPAPNQIPGGRAGDQTYMGRDGIQRTGAQIQAANNRAENDATVRNLQGHPTGGQILGKLLAQLMGKPPTVQEKASNLGGTVSDLASRGNGGRRLANGGKRPPRLVPGRRVNLPAWKKISIDMDEVTSGHMVGGRRLNPGNNKDLFPADMSVDQVERAIRQAYRHGTAIRSQGDSRVFIRGIYEGMTIEMWVNKDSRQIETAWRKTE